MPVGLYNSTIISCDFGNNVAIHSVNYLSHYIIGDEVIINNVNELVTTNHAKFGNGILKKANRSLSEFGWNYVTKIQAEKSFLSMG